MAALTTMMSVAGAVALIGATSQGCTVTSGDGDGGDFSFDSGPTGDSAVTTDGGTIPGNAACNSCLFQQCSGQHAVCNNTAECFAIYTCAIQPGKTGADVQACIDAHPVGKEEYTALYKCDLAARCAPGCTTACSVPAAECAVDASTPDTGTATDAAGQPDTCSSCTESQCKTENDKCGAGTACDQYNSCAAACADANCLATCDSTNAAGRTDAANLATCTVGKCGTACGF